MSDLCPEDVHEPEDVSHLVGKVPDVLVLGQHWRCSCGLTSLHVTQTHPTVGVAMQCRHCREVAEWVPFVPPPDCPSAA